MQVYTCIVSICKRIVKRVYLSTLRRLIIKSLRKESKMVQTKKQHAIFDNCPFVCINFDFSWLNKARPGCRYIWAFNLTASAKSLARIL